MGASRGVSSHVDKGNCSSSDGKEVSSGGTGEGDSGGTDAGDIPCVAWRLWMDALNNKGGRGHRGFVISNTLI